MGSEAAAAPPYKDFGRILILRVEAVWKGEKGGRVGVLIAESAGAIVSDWKGNKLFPMDIDNYAAQELETVGGNKKVYSEMLAILK